MLVNEIRKIKKRAKERRACLEKSNQNEITKAQDNKFYNLFTDVWSVLQSSASQEYSCARIFQIPIEDKINRKGPWIIENLQGLSERLSQKLTDEGFFVYIEERDCGVGGHGHVVKHYLIATW